MRRRPRRIEEPLFGRSMILSGLIQGLGVMVAVLAVYIYGMASGSGEGQARMSAFVCLVIANLGLIFTNRSMARSFTEILRIPNKALWWITGGAFGFLVLVTTNPLMREVFRFATIHGDDVGLITLAVLASLLISESVKSRVLSRLIFGNAQSN
jgi:P-type Ca2+ transporter type 2C